MLHVVIIEKTCLSFYPRREIAKNGDKNLQSYSESKEIKKLLV